MPPPQETIKTRILIISDTHSAPLTATPLTPETPSSPTPTPKPFRHPLPKADVLLHCGDMTMYGHETEYEKTLDMLKQIDAGRKFVIAGNHDRTLDGEWMGRHEGELEEEERGGKGVEMARRVWGKGGRARREGVVLLEEGVHEVEVGNGAVLRLYTSQYQPEYYDWAFPYSKTQDRFNPPHQTFSDAQNTSQNPIPSFSEKHLDIIMTHGPPFKRGDQTASGNVGCPHLLKALVRAKPLLHCFGHIHEGWGAEMITWADEEGGEEKDFRCEMREWMDGGWEGSVKGVRKLECEEQRREGGCVFLEAQQRGGGGGGGGGDEVVGGGATLFVNAAVMDVGYEPVNAPFVVDIDLPRVRRG